MWTLVTGGANRLGAEICLALARKGYPVVVHYNRSRKEAEDVVSTCLSYGVEADLIQGSFSSVAEVQKFIEEYLKRFPKTQALINNVGNYLIQSALNTSVSDWISLFQTNLHAPFALMQALIPSIRQEKGSIINLGVTGIQGIHANTRSTAYALTKMGLWFLTRSLAQELASDGVRVNMVSPGYLDIAVDLPKNLDQLPMHRPAACSEVARVILFLLSAESQYITGQNIEVGGGLAL
jgi:NAD(P)-dependent dehydrogenase (short-subunit alcohol dehydrogenase family)